MRFRLTLTRLHCSLRQLVEMKLAAAEVEGVGVATELFAKRLGERVDALLALLFDFDESGFFEDAEVFRDVVGSDVKRFAEFGHGLGCVVPPGLETSQGSIPRMASFGWRVRTDQSRCR